jgi:hypothetical protein
VTGSKDGTSGEGSGEEEGNEGAVTTGRNIFVVCPIRRIGSAERLKLKPLLVSKLNPDLSPCLNVWCIYIVVIMSGVYI